MDELTSTFLPFPNCHRKYRISVRVTEGGVGTARGCFAKPSNLCCYPVKGDLTKEDASEDTKSFEIWSWQPGTAGRTL